MTRGEKPAEVLPRSYGTAADLPHWKPALAGVVQFTVWGVPIPMGRPRVVARQGRPIAITPERTTDYRLAVQAAWREAGGLRLKPGLIAAEMAFLFARPESHYLKDGSLSAAGRKAVPGGTSDLSNLDKNVEDALNGMAWEDDRFIVWHTAGKDWTRRGSPAHATVLAWVIDPDSPWRPQ